MSSSAKDLYARGASLESIASSLLTTEEGVINQLRQYKVKEGRSLTQEFKELVADRFLTGDQKGEICKVFNVAHRTINRILDEFNISSSSVSSPNPNLFEPISWRRFDMCPTCHTKDVGDLNIYRDEGKDYNHSFCRSCNYEWFEEGGLVYKVNFEFLE